MLTYQYTSAGISGLLIIYIEVENGDFEHTREENKVIHQRVIRQAIWGDIGVLVLQVAHGKL